MSRRAGVLIGLALAIVAAAGIAWVYRLEILLEMVEIRQHVDVAPTRTIEWDSGSDPAGRSETERPPNIVVILADDLGWNDLSWLGGGVAGGTVPTPNIDSLAREGIHFANGYAANGTCAPSRAALMTGRYGTRFGFEFTPTPAGFSTLVPQLGNARPGTSARTPSSEDVGPSIPYNDMGMPPVRDHARRVAEAPAGYHNVHIGKWHLGLERRHGATRPGLRREPPDGERPLSPRKPPGRRQLEAGLRRHRPVPVACLELRRIVQRRPGVRARRLPDRLLHGPGRPGRSRPTGTDRSSSTSPTGRCIRPCRR